MDGSFDGTLGSDPVHQDRPHRWLGAVRLQMVWDNLSCLGTEALALLEFRRLSTDVAIVAVRCSAPLELDSFKRRF
jgi:hypothetical protein